MIEDEKANVQWELDNGIRRPTDEEMKEAGDQWIQHLIDLRKGK